ncbi:dynein regulatory complex subunit 3 [Scleropages formosus]|uniref:dynein regulatory complex subunit 3 n=1 Tax=Scleropages formosus TaxID=113540 RepID=UPI000879120B|nr:dynein regulatory complex subunit 3 [Scleropages formosus]XP_018610236.1 dynein regulatory complex subunit 3 [Scleropages formosus]XP_018610237.1 dynein regulatory complex subunit 3 [Scleropages formosus]
MSSVYDTVEPSVVDEEMLQKAVEEQGPQGQAGRIARDEGVQYHEVCQLCLDYRNILKIDHLWQFTSLTKLQLDNNIIEKIEGLERLTNLVWLDLSFNKIEVIEGLDTLVKLEDLSLYHNRISIIENMDSLQKLHVLSLGNNLLRDLDNVVYLRKFKNLRTLNLAGNPLCKESNYKVFIAAHFPELVYLDFRILDKQTREEALSKYQVVINDMRKEDLLELKALDVKRRDEEELQLHKDAFVEFLNGPYLFESMYADDTEAVKLAYLPGVPQLLDSFQSQMVALCMQVFEMGLEQHHRRKAEVSCFFECSLEAVRENQQKATELVAAFESCRRETLVKMQQTTDPKLLEAQQKQHLDETCQLRDKLMILELQLVDQLEEIIKDFERNITDMVGGFIESVQGIFAQCRDLENNHNERLQEIAVAALDKAAANELEEDMPEGEQLPFFDKDTVMNAVSASHDIHLLKIDKREDELVTRINSWMTVLMKSIQDAEGKRNRKRISEIHHYIDYVKTQLDEVTLHRTL